MINSSVAFKRVTASALINEGETLLVGVLILTSAATGAVAIYEGLDAVTGRLVHTFTCDAARSVLYSLPVPLLLERGLYVSMDANVTEVTVFWLPGRVG